MSEKTGVKRLVEMVREALKSKDESKINTALDAAALAAADAEGALAARGMSDEQIKTEIKASEDRILAGIKGELKLVTDSFSEQLKTKAPAVSAEDAEKARALQESLRAEATKDADKAAVATDSAYLADSFQEAVSGAEILVPGIQVPTFDSKAAPSPTLDTICALRKNALALAYATTDGKALIDAVSGGKPLELAKMSCGDTRTLFRAATAVRKSSNNFSVHSTQDRDRKDDKQAPKPAIRSVADLNAMFREHYKKSAPAAN